MSQIKKIIGIVQPTYLPWLPFFERMAYSDVFIYLDDVKYSKNSFHNRNAIKSTNGRLMLTVPVKYSGNSSALINEILIDSKSKWWKKHWQSIQQCYSKAPFFNYYHDELEELYTQPSEKLIQVIKPFVEFLRRALNISTPCYYSSEVGVPGTRNQKLVNLCHHFKGTHFIVKPGTVSYHPPEDFLPYGIEFYHLNYITFKYPQLHGAFEPLLSALDFVLNSGPVEFMKILERHRDAEN